MNKTNVRRVASAILAGELATRKRNPIGFNLVTFFSENHHFSDKTGHNCGTVACVAGWAHVIAGGKKTSDFEKIWADARKFLGLTEIEANHLFCPAVNRSEVTQQQAALVLFNLAETGEIDYSIAGAA